MNTITNTTQALRGQLCWGVTWDSQLNMSMSFGEPYLRICDPFTSKSRSRRMQEFASYRHVTVKGKWWLWIFCAYWKLTVNDSLSVTGSSSHRMKMMAMARLNGQKLRDIRVNPLTGATEFTFDLGATLQARRFEKSDSAIWTLYKPNGFCLGIRGDGTYTYNRGTTAKMIPRKIETPNQSVKAIAFRRRKAVPRA